MKFLIVLAALVAVASAGGYGNGASSRNGYGQLQSSGSSSQFRSDDNYGNYKFSYDESHATGGSSRREEQQNGVRTGSYSLTDADGRKRTVTYVADAHGFRATVHSNEPGVESKDPADVYMIKEGGYAAPAQQSYTSNAPSIYQQRSTIASYGYGAAATTPVYQQRAFSSSSYASKPRVVVRVAPVSRYQQLAAPMGYQQQQQEASSYESAAPQVAGNYGQQQQQQQGYSDTAAPRAFSYSFGTTHSAPAAAASYRTDQEYASGPAPIYQQEQQRASSY